MIFIITVSDELVAYITSTHFPRREVRITEATSEIVCQCRALKLVILRCNNLTYNTLQALPSTSHIINEVERVCGALEIRYERSDIE